MVDRRRSHQDIRGAGVRPPARACPLCGGRDAITRLETGRCSFEGAPYCVVACRQCGLCFTSPAPVHPQELQTLYGESFFGRSTSRLFALFLAAVNRERRRTLSRGAPGRILDLGCGAGEFLSSLKERGWDVWGTDVYEAACTLASSRGLSVHCGDLASAAFPTGYFDVVTASHVVEHLPEPRLELAEIKRVLRADGELIVEVPNFAAVTSRVCGAYWYNLDVPRHVQHFTPAALERLLRECGFIPIRVRNHHLTDLPDAFYSILGRLGVLRAMGIRTVGRDSRRMSLLSKMAFALAAAPIGLFCAPYSLAVPLLTGNGECITMTATGACM